MKHTLFNNYYSKETEEETRQYLFDEKNDDEQWKNKEEIPDNDVWEEMNFQNEINWEDFEIEFTQFIQGNQWLVCGSFGGWRGRQAAGSLISSFRELSVAWQDCDYIDIYDENGHLYIKCSHHDGTNYYELKRVTPKGYEFLSNNYYKPDEETHEKAFNCNLFTALPHYAHTVWGCKKYA
jgi:hypothetical protein